MNVGLAVPLVLPENRPWCVVFTSVTPALGSSMLKCQEAFFSKLLRLALDVKHASSPVLLCGSRDASTVGAWAEMYCG